MALVLTRKENESVLIDGDILVKAPVLSVCRVEILNHAGIGPSDTLSLAQSSKSLYFAGKHFPFNWYTKQEGLNWPRIIKIKLALHYRFRN